MMVAESEILNASLLIVDDQEANVSLEEMLRDAGYARVCLDHEPARGLRAASKNRYDLILLDLQPARHGWIPGDRSPQNQRCGRLSSGPRAQPPGHKLRALQAGARDFISKPFDLVEVKTRIRSIWK